MAEPQNIAEFQKAVLLLANRYLTAKGRNVQTVTEVIGSLDIAKMRLHTDEQSRQNTEAMARFRDTLGDHH